MKCIKNLKTNEITRVDDQTADRLCSNPQLFWFVPRAEWKAKVRDAVKAKVKTVEETTKHDETKKRRAKNHKKIAERQNRI